MQATWVTLVAGCLMVLAVGLGLVWVGAARSGRRGRGRVLAAAGVLVALLGAAGLGGVGWWAGLPANERFDLGPEWWVRHEGRRGDERAYWLAAQWLVRERGMGQHCASSENMFRRMNLPVCGLPAADRRWLCEVWAEHAARGEGDSHWWREARVDLAAHAYASGVIDAAAFRAMLGEPSELAGGEDRLVLVGSGGWAYVEPPRWLDTDPGRGASPWEIHRVTLAGGRVVPVSGQRSVTGAWGTPVGRLPRWVLRWAGARRDGWRATLGGVFRTPVCGAGAVSEVVLPIEVSVSGEVWVFGGGRVAEAPGVVVVSSAGRAYVDSGAGPAEAGAGWVTLRDGRVFPASRGVGGLDGLLRWALRLAGGWRGVQAVTLRGGLGREGVDARCVVWVFGDLQAELTRSAEEAAYWDAVNEARIARGVLWAKRAKRLRALVNRGVELGLDGRSLEWNMVLGECLAEGTLGAEAFEAAYGGALVQVRDLRARAGAVLDAVALDAWLGCGFALDGTVTLRGVGRAREVVLALGDRDGVVLPASLAPGRYEAVVNAELVTQSVFVHQGVLPPGREAVRVHGSGSLMVVAEGEVLAAVVEGPALGRPAQVLLAGSESEARALVHFPLGTEGLHAYWAVFAWVDGERVALGHVSYLRAVPVPMSAAVAMRDAGRVDVEAVPVGERDGWVVGHTVRGRAVVHRGVIVRGGGTFVGE